MKYYRIRPDISGYPGRWVLGDIEGKDNWLFMDPAADFMEPMKYKLDVHICGEEVDFSLAGYACVPVVSDRVLGALSGLPEVDEAYKHVVLAPVAIEGRDVAQNYFVMIVETKVDCIDVARSKFERFAVDDPVRPDLAGQFSVFTRLILDPTRFGAAHIFRLEGYGSALIVSEEVKRRLDCAGATGISYQQVVD